MQTRTLLLAVVLCGIATPSAVAQTVDDIVAKHVAAIGGTEKWAALQSLMVSSRSPYFSFDSAWKRPNRFRFDAWSDAVTDTDTRAFDGTTGWRLNSLEGATSPRTMAAQEIAELRDEFDWMQELIDYKGKRHRISLQGTVAVGGQPAHRLELTRPSGAVVQIFIDVKTGLEVQRIKWARSPAGEDTELVLPVGDYRAVGGLMLPHRVGTATRSYQVNVAIPDSRFQRPGLPDAAASAPGRGYGPGVSEADFARAKVAQATEQLLPVGTVAPAWSLADPQGRTVRSSELSGNVLVLEFWATWCVPCHRVMPEMQRLHTDFASRGVVVLGISTSEVGGDPAQLMKDRGYTYKILVNGEKIAPLYRVIGMPVTYVVGLDGRILKADVGADPTAGESRRALIARYLTDHGR